MKKQCGKFIKRNSNVLKVASIKDFSFEDIATTPLVTFDNKERSLIHTKLHSSNVIEGIVNPDNRCDIDLVDTANERGLLWPVDFTQEVVSGEEYSNLCKNYKDYDKALSNQYQPVQYETLTPENATEESLDSNLEALDSSSSSRQSDNSDFKPLESLNTNNLADISKEDNEANLDFSSDKDTSSSSTLEAKDSKDSKVEDILDSNIEKKLDTVLEAEKYLNNDLSNNSKENSSTLEEEYNRGYQTAKQEISKNLEQEKTKIKETIELITDNFKNIVDGLSGLKKSILDSANKNFYEISQAVSENLLKKEFNLNPESFISVINQALSNIDNNNIKVKVSHNMYEKLNSLDSSISKNLEGILEEDIKISDGDFKIESDINAIDGSIHSIVTKLLDEYDLNLFQKEDNSKNTKDEVEKVEVVEEELNKVS